MGNTRSVKLTEARSTFSSIVNEVYRSHDRVLVEKSGIPVAAIVSVADLERLKRDDDERAARAAVLERIARKFEEYTPQRLEEEVAKAVAEVRGEYSTVASNQ